MKDEKFYKPSKDIIKSANVKNYEKYRQDAIIDLEGFWEDAAKELDWYKKWNTVLDDSKAPFFKWFKGSKTNIVLNAIDRHIKTKGKKVAIIYEDEKGRSRKITYSELNDEVCKFANVLETLGIKKGDRVVTYMPNIPEQAIAMLGCAKSGVIHSVVYAGFSHEALRKRINESGAKLIVFADGSYRKGKEINLQEIAEEALKKAPSVKKAIVVNNLEKKPKLNDKRELIWDELMEKASNKAETVKMDSTDPLFILYTSGTTGEPKGVVHDHGGYQVGISRTLKWVFDIKDNDIYWCTADPGWITGHSYIIYGPLILGTTTLMYEGAPIYPTPDIWWKIIDKYKVTVFYTAPTAVRLFMGLGDKHIKKHKLTSLRLLGSVGEPINPSAWKWYYEFIGKKKCPIMDTWWQTETGMFMITPVPTMDLKPGSAGKPFAGIQAFIVDENEPHEILRPEEKGLLVIDTPWPAMLTTLYNSPKRYIEKYWKDIPGYYLTGDYAMQDLDGYFWIEGRSDDVIKIAGHRIGSAEVENALVSHKDVAEAAVIGVADELRGEVILAYVLLKKGVNGSPKLKDELKQHVRNEFGPIAVIKDIEFKDKLPKTRSGKIMRRVLRAWSKGEDPGDLSTLQD
ncbi:MAG: acetate--CoA ligase [Candidatus Woesearchaeota archaeon]|nr:MAG: acetate--CoA ligase [Candidatus Woesearchaeota archaeon]